MTPSRAIHQGHRTNALTGTPVAHPSQNTSTSAANTVVDLRTSAGLGPKMPGVEVSPIAPKQPRLCCYCHEPLRDSEALAHAACIEEQGEPEVGRKPLPLRSILGKALTRPYGTYLEEVEVLECGHLGHRCPLDSLDGLGPESLRTWTLERRELRAAQVAYGDAPTRRPTKRRCQRCAWGEAPLYPSVRASRLGYTPYALPSRGRRSVRPVGLARSGVAGGFFFSSLAAELEAVLDERDPHCRCGAPLPANLPEGDALCFRCEAKSRCLKCGDRLGKGARHQRCAGCRLLSALDGEPERVAVEQEPGELTVEPDGDYLDHLAREGS